MRKLPILQKGDFGKIQFNHTKSVATDFYLFVYLLFLLLLFFILILRLIQLTIVKGGYYSQLSEQNRIRELLIEPKRGKIVDRKGLIFAQNSGPDIKKNASRIESKRTYFDGETISHIVGYRQKADEQDIKNDPCLIKIKIGDKVGKKGVEKIFDCRLRGKSGKKLIEVNAAGKYLRTLSLLPPTDGDTVQLALDLDLQKKAYELIKDKKATVIGLKPQTGEVVILVSSPAYDPQAFEDENQKITSSYLTDKNKPLFNRATEGTYAPGSIFKLVLATGALEEKSIDDKTLIEDTGTLKAGPLSFGNWYFLQYGKTDGMIDIVKAIRRSNDIFFYKVGDLLTPAKIKKWAEILGYGSLTGIGLDETEGLIPSEFWKKETVKDQWYLGDTYNLSIGQGYLLVTPLQATMATSIIANNGYLCKPQLLKVETRHASSLQQCKKLPISQKTLDLIREGMKEACSSGGTGWPLFDFKPQVACKTGTAESHGEKTLPHAWFTTYAPYDKPEIILTVLIEESGQGSDVAAPIAKEILKTYFERKE